MSERQDGLRDRAAANVEANFKAQRDAQAKDHAREDDRMTNVGDRKSGHSTTTGPKPCASTAAPLPN